MSKQETMRNLDILINFFDNYNKILDKLENRIEEKRADKKAA